MEFFHKNAKRTLFDLIVVLTVALGFAVFNLFVNISDRLYFYFAELRSLPYANFIIDILFVLILGLIWVLYKRWYRTNRREKELQNILESINPDVLLVIDKFKRIYFVNEAVRAMFGYEPEELAGSRIDILFGLSEENDSLTAEIYKHLREQGFFIGTTVGIRKDGSEVPLELIEGKLKYNGGYVILLRDITERKRAQDALNFRLEFEKLLATISTKFINIAPDRIDEQIKNSLKTLTQFLYADRGYFFLYHRAAQRFKKVYEWCNDKLVSVPEMSKLVSPHEYPVLMGKIVRKEVVYFPRITLIPAQFSKELERWREQGVMSVVWVPIVYSGDLVGFVGFDSFHLELDLGDEDIGLLRMFGEIIVNAVNRKQRENELREKTIQLERSNKELEQFAYITSHDLQGPLRKITGYIRLLQRRYAGKLGTDADDFLGYIVQSAEKMRRLINDLLIYSRVGNHPIMAEWVDMEKVLLQVMGNLEEEIQKTGAKIEYSNLPKVWADPIQMEELLQNLLSNAIKFHGDEPPRVRISARRTGQFWEFAVSDNGIGIPQEFHNRIFIIFQRLHTEDKYPGTGIGLAICKKIVHRHGGEIWVKSSPGEGATFYFTIPARAPTDSEKERASLEKIGQ